SESWALALTPRKATPSGPNLLASSARRGAAARATGQSLPRKTTTTSRLSVRSRRAWSLPRWSGSTSSASGPRPWRRREGRPPARPSPATRARTANRDRYDCLREDTAALRHHFVAAVVTRGGSGTTRSSGPLPDAGLWKTTALPFHTPTREPAFSF